MIYVRIVKYTIMSTQPLPAQTSQIVTQSMYGIDPHQILNMTMTNIVTEHMIKIIKSASGLTFGKICQLFAIMSLDEIRKAIMSMIKQLFTYIGANHLSILEWINKNILQNTFIVCIKQIINYIASFFMRQVQIPIKLQSYNQRKIK